MIAIQGLSTEDLQRERTCATCGKSYAIVHTSKQHFEPLYDYTRGCVANCITCWLGCGPQQDGIEGNLLRELGLHLSPDTHIVVMPLTRVHIEEPIRFLSHAIIYPPGMARMKELNIVEPSDTSSLGRLENIVPEFQKRRDLFRELNRYIGAVIDHMLQHSEFSWESYLEVRAKLDPYNH